MSKTLDDLLALATAYARTHAAVAVRLATMADVETGPSRRYSLAVDVADALNAER